MFRPCEDTNYFIVLQNSDTQHLLYAFFLYFCTTNFSDYDIFDRLLCSSGKH